MDDGAGSQAPVNVETSRKGNAEEPGHEQDDAARGGEEPDQGSMADASMHQVMRLMLWLWQSRTRQQGSSDELVLLVLVQAWWEIGSGA